MRSMWQRYKLLEEVRFLVPLVLLLWLLVSVPLSLARAEAVDPATDPACPQPGEDPTEGVWGQRDQWGKAWTHITVLNPCYKAKGTLVHGDVWGDDDRNLYVLLDPGYREDLGVASGEWKKLQRWAQARNTADWLAETIPLHQDKVLDPCLDTDQRSSSWTSNYPCWDTTNKAPRGMKATITGVLGRDNNHGWKESHPVRKIEWTDAEGINHVCSVATEQNVNCASPVIPYVPPPKEGGGGKKNR
jgi:hypothetical protein